MNLEQRIRAAFQADPRIHCLTLGACTAHKSPGNFAAFTDRTGKWLHSLERDDALEALAALCDHVCERPTPPDVETLPLPGMITRVDDDMQLPGFS